MAEILILDPEQIRDIYGKGSLVIMSSDTWGEFTEEEKQKLRNAAEDYEFDGDPDSYVNVVLGRNTDFVKEAFGEFED
jgi:hypothetical protein